MVLIKRNQKDRNCNYQAHVWFSRHSHQCGCFRDKKRAEHWADSLAKKIVTADMIREIYGQH